MKISFSSCNKYYECGFKFFLHYYRKLRPVQERSSLIFGSAIDEGLNKLLLTKNLNDAENIFLEYWNHYKLEKNLKYSKADLETHLLSEVTGEVQADSWASLKQKGLIILKEYNEQVIPKIKNVIQVQIDDAIKNDSGDELTVKTDFIAEMHDGSIVLFDNKTSSVKYEADSVKKSEQLATYYEALQEKYKVTHCGYIVIPKVTRKKKLPVIEIEIIIDKVDEKTIEETFKKFETTLDAIKEAKFEKNTNNCISKYGKCEYFDFCKHGSLKGLTEK